MNRNWDKSFNYVIQSEGGYADLDGDTGGPTNHGCTQAVWEEYVGHPVTVEDMKNLTVEDVKPLYKKRYWDAIHGDALPSGLDYAMFDASINSGIGNSSRWIQEIVGVPVDGAIGNNTVSAISQINPVTLINEFSDKRLVFLQRLKLWPKYGDGWGKRVELVRIRAIEMS